jgi:proteasome lid subunit RPN8/RPN11
MLTLKVPPEIAKQITLALSKNGNHECGGILMGEHTGEDHFTVRKVSIHRKGTFSSFVRLIDEALDAMNAFWHEHKGDYKRFNYIGEWHSHPQFPEYPSPKDDESMVEIVNDDSVGANFAVLMVVKLNGKRLVGTAHTYLPGGYKAESILDIPEMTVAGDGVRMWI